MIPTFFYPSISPDNLKSPTPSNEKLSPDLEQPKSSSSHLGKLPALTDARPRNDLDSDGTLSRDFENMKPFSET
jgi:hypothetical protein